MRALVASGLALAASLCLIAPAKAGIAGDVHPQPDAPITITRCAADVRFSENRWGTFSSTLNTYVDFRNTSSKSAVAVLFRLQLSNAFGDVLDNIFGQATGQFAPSAVITGNHWSDTDRWAGLGIIECSVARVLFSDDSTWIAPKDQASPTPSPTASTGQTPTP